MKHHLNKYLLLFLSTCFAIALCCANSIIVNPPISAAIAKSTTSSKYSKKKTKKVTKAKDGKALVDSWKLTQSSNLIGPLIMIVSNKGVRLNAEKMGLLWIFKAPDWDAYLYNVETNNYCSFKYEVWKKRGFFMSGTASRREASRNSLKSLKVKRTGKTKKIANMTVEQVYFLLADGTKYGEFWVTSKIAVPSQFKELVASMLRLPSHSSGTPLKAAIARGKGAPLSPVLDTQAVVHKKVDPDLFKPLKGYKRVKDEMALLFSGTDMFGTSRSDTISGGKSHSSTRKKK